MAEKPFRVIEKLSRGLAETWVGPTPQRRKHGAYFSLACDYQLSLMLRELEELWVQCKMCVKVQALETWKEKRPTGWWSAEVRCMWHREWGMGHGACGI